MACQKCHILYKRRVSKSLMHAEGKKATPASKAADNETKRRGAIPQFPSKAITCTQIEIRHLFKIDASSLFVSVFKFDKKLLLSLINCRLLIYLYFTWY
jgi:hypothetical protein